MRASMIEKEERMAKKNKRKQRNQQGSADTGFGRQQSQEMGQPRQPDRDSSRKQFQQQNRRGRGQQH